jgi:hypothetical protein
MYGLEKITIHQYQYDDMQRKIAKLKALEDAGVQNWGMYTIALEEWQKKVDIEDSIQTAIDDVNDLLTEADIDQPAGSGCGYAISYDEKAMAKILNSFYERHSKLRLL